MTCIMDKRAMRLKSVSKMIQPHGIYKYKVHSIPRGVCNLYKMECQG